ncbi:MAG: T9SS type A sorting domain-containing protein [FCB group bacterium]|nr:T9SS type A sorting domain-containing protein [FCB group bacterium]
MNRIKILLLLLMSTIVAAQPYFTPVESTGVPYIIIITDVNVAGNGLVPGAEIAVFDDSLCVGVGVFDGNFNYQFSAWQSNPSQELAGYLPGAVMGFKVWTLSDGIWQEFEATPVYEAGDGSFGNGVYAVLSLNISVVGIGSGSQLMQPKNFALEAYPNPFNGEISIPITLSDQSVAKLSIISMQGCEVWSCEVRGSDQIQWKGLDQFGHEMPTGIYMIVLSSESQQIVEPITLLK